MGFKTMFGREMLNRKVCFLQVSKEEGCHRESGPLSVCFASSSQDKNTKKNEHQNENKNQSDGRDTPSWVKRLEDCT
jgi:hypothetical protein